MLKNILFWFAAGAVAQNTTLTTSFWWKYIDHNELYATVLASNSAGITYGGLECVPGTGMSAQCDLEGWTAVDRPDTKFVSTYIASPTAQTATIGCSFNTTATGVCTMLIEVPEANSTIISSKTISGDSLDYVTIYVTGGFDKLPATALASATAQSGSKSTSIASSTQSRMESVMTSIAKPTGPITTSTESSATTTDSGSAASTTLTGGSVAQFAAPVAGVLGIFAAALAL